MRKSLLKAENAGLRVDLRYRNIECEALKKTVARLELEKIPAKICPCCGRKFRNPDFTKFCPHCADLKARMTS